MESTPRRRITRNRELLACTECRKRKLKCDRCAPCGSCVKRGDEAVCTYQRLTKESEHESERERRLQAESRLEHLEQLVQQLSQQRDESSHEMQFTAQVAGHEIGAGNSRPDNDTLVSNGLLYNGSTHWSAMLEDIEELRNTIISGDADAQEEDGLESQPDVAANLILGKSTPLSVQQVLAQNLPSKQDSDSLVAAYFRSAGIAAPFIHASSFQRQYQQFWDSPRETSGLWISILFSIYHVASNTLILTKGNSNPINKYIVSSASCLAQSEYFRPQKFAVESLLLFVQAQILTGPSMSPITGLLFGLLHRLATSMGYHRDPEPFQLSAFEKEMRRRVWSLLMQLDLLISFQLGLPSNVQHWDTLPPRNLYDADFDEETVELPPSRPDSENTNVVFYIAKHRLMTVFEKIFRHSLAPGVAFTPHVDELDDEIRKVYSDLPWNLRPKTISESIFDSPTMVVTRLCVFNLYQKCLCVLHRPYVTRERLQSIQTCHDAALNIVRYFNDAYGQFLPGGQLEAERWFLRSLTWHDYLLGVTALCLALCAGSKQFPEILINVDETLDILEQAHDICIEQSVRSKDSRRVWKLIDATTLRFKPLDSRVSRLSSRNSDGHADLFDLPSMRTSLLDRAGDSDFSMLNGLRDSAAQTNTIITSPNDFSWDYLEQFLNLPGDDIMTIE